METVIRHYLPSDQPELFEISADTAYFGDPVEAFLEDRQLYIDAFARYYTQYETSLIWIADSSQGIIGFLLGCADTFYQLRRWRKYIFSKVLVNAISVKYRLGHKTASFALGLLTGAVRGEEPQVSLREYPAHLQIDVKAGHRGEGIGRCLIEAYLDQLRGLHIHGVHLETTDHNETACFLYEKVGFQLVDERENRFWTRRLGYVVKNRTYGMRLE